MHQNSSTEQPHSPLPWLAETDTRHTFIMAADDTVVFEGDTHYFGGNLHVNARLIVRTMNAHGPLLARVERAEAALEQVERTLSNFSAVGAAQDELDGLLLLCHEATARGESEVGDE